MEKYHVKFKAYYTDGTTEVWNEELSKGRYDYYLNSERNRRVMAECRKNKRVNFVKMEFDRYTLD